MRTTIVALFVAASAGGAGAAFAPPQQCPSIAPDPIPIAQLPSKLPAQQIVNVQTLLDSEAIRRALSLYAFAIDGRDFDSLSNIFAQHAIANYSAPLGVLTGLDTIKTSLAAGLAQFTGTQHMLGSQYIDVCGPGGSNAVSVSYYRAAHFLPRNDSGGAVGVVDDSSVLYAWGQYQDTWKKEKGAWKIVYRNLVYMGPLVIDLET